jgi:hypothetical protein
LIKQVKTFMTVQSSDVLDEQVNEFLKTLPNQEPYPKIHYYMTPGSMNNMAAGSMVVEYLVKEEDS